MIGCQFQCLFGLSLACLGKSVSLIELHTPLICKFKDKHHCLIVTQVHWLIKHSTRLSISSTSNSQALLRLHLTSSLTSQATCRLCIASSQLQ